MTDKGFTGISFPFRIGVKGGVVMSTTNVTDVQHIVEAMTQILCTRPMERCMEYHFKSEIDTSIFEPNDVSFRTLLSYEIRKSLQELEDRITVDSVEVTSDGEYVYAKITFTSLLYGKTHTANIKVGDIDG